MQTNILRPVRILHHNNESIVMWIEPNAQYTNFARPIMRFYGENHICRADNYASILNERYQENSDFQPL